MKKKLLSIILVTSLFATMLAGCGNNGGDEVTSETPTTTAPVENDSTDDIEVQEDVKAEAVEIKGGTLRVGIAADPVSLAPFVGMSFGGIATRRTIYEFLIDREGFGGEMVGIIMESYKETGDNTYELTIYDYIYDTANNHLTASDVAFSYNKAIELGNLPKLSVIESVTVLDDYTVEFVFNRELALGELDAIWSEAPIVTQAAYEASPDGMSTTPVGTTAYELEEYVSGSRIILKNTGNYWQEDTSLYAPYSYNNWEEIDFEIITESAQLAIALETGAIDISSHIPSQEIARFAEGSESSEGKVVSSYYENTSISLAPNCDESNPLSNQKLREAIFYAIDAGQVLQGAYNGKGKVCNTYGADVFGDYNPEWDNEEYFEYDLEKAKELLKEAGYSEGELSLRMITITDEDVIEAATIIQAFLLQLGIDVEINSYENAMYNNQLLDPAAWDLMLATQASGDYIVNLWKLMYDRENYNSNSSQNFVRDDKLQELLEACITPEGHTEKNMDAFHDYLKEKAYGRGICSSIGYIAHSDIIDTVVLDFRNQVMPGSCKPVAN